MNKILVVIPAYNEKENIGEVITEIKKENLPLDILIVDDGSKDGTSETAKRYGATVATLPINLGIGGARQTGLIYASRYSYDLCLQMDADGQHPAENIKKLLAASQSAEVIIGSRFLGKANYKVPSSRSLGINLLSFVLKLLTGRKITDPTSGLRIFSGEAISFLAKYYPTDYPEVEPILFLHWAGFKIKEIPVLMRPRKSGKSSIAPFYYMLKVIFALFINLLRERPQIKD